MKREYLEERKRCFYSLSCLFWLCTCVCGVHGLWVLHVIFFSTFVSFSLSQVILQGILSIIQRHTGFDANFGPFFQNYSYCKPSDFFCNIFNKGVGEIDTDPNFLFSASYSIDTYYC